MAEEIRLLLDIAIILFSAKILGEVAERMKIDAMVGEIVAGLIVGPLLGFISPTPMLASLSTIGIVILLFLIGLSIRMDEIKGNIWNGSVIAIIAAILSLIGGFGLGIVIFDSWIVGAVIGVVLMGTSTSMSIKSLLRIGQLKTKAGQMLVTIVMADDIVTMLGLSLFSAWIISGYVSISNAVLLGLGMVGFTLLFLTLGSKLSDKIFGFFQRMQDEQMLITLPIVVMLVLSWLSNSIGITAVAGAFLAGIAMSKSIFVESIISPKVKTLGHGFFIPIFFAYSAIIMDLTFLAQWWWVVAILFAVGVLTKVIPSGLMAWRLGCTKRDAGTIAIGMIPRGEYGIVIAQLAFSAGAIASSIYGSLILFIIISVIATPIFFRLYTKQNYDNSRLGSRFSGYKR